MTTRLRQFVQRICTFTGAGKSVQTHSCAAPTKEETCANLPSLHVPSQSVNAVCDFNTAQYDPIDSEKAINNMTAEDARRAIITRPVQF